MFGRQVTFSCHNIFFSPRIGFDFPLSRVLRNNCTLMFVCQPFCFRCFVLAFSIVFACLFDFSKIQPMNEANGLLYDERGGSKKALTGKKKRSVCGRAGACKTRSFATQIQSYGSRCAQKSNSRQLCGKTSTNYYVGR